MVRYIDCPAMTIAVEQQNKQTQKSYYPVNFSPSGVHQINQRKISLRCRSVYVIIKLKWLLPADPKIGGI